jgi:chemotaxis protein methyltransferase CheR
VFFRDAEHCEVLARRVLPALGRAPGRRAVRLWSAGCGAGHDAWSLAMLVEEADLPARVAVAILATDGDARQLAQARDAVYPELELARVDAARRRRHFVRGVGPRRGLWRVIAPLRDRVELTQLELHAPWPPLGAFDVVCGYGAFPRGDRAAAARLAQRFAGVLAPGGVLLVGAAELHADDAPGLEREGRTMFRRPAR